MHATMLSKRCLSLLILLASSCGVTIPNIRLCSVAGVLAGGGDCTYTLSDKKEKLTLDEMLDFLEGPKGDGPAICTSTNDFNREATALAEACRILGPRCTKEIVEAIEKAQAKIALMRSLK